MEHLGNRLKKIKINVVEEYNKLYNLFYKDIVGFYGFGTFHSWVNEHFNEFPKKFGMDSLDEFDNKMNLKFSQKQSCSENDLILFCEYLLFICNQVNYIRFSVIDISAKQKYSQIKYKTEYLKNSFGWMSYEDENGFIYLNKKNKVSSYVAKLRENKDIEFDILKYNHYSMKGNLNGKKEILRNIADKLEPKNKRKIIERFNKELESDLFTGFNNCNIRHNNLDSTYVEKYTKSFDDLSNEDKEKLYDYLYKCCLIALLSIDIENEVGKDLIKTMGKH